MLWKKPANMKYTDMCIFIDKNIPIIATPGKDPEVENLVYNYLFLLVKALAIKKRMFTNFEDYDGYAFHSASRLFFALRNNYNNQGKTIKGKQIKSIKSCLNYTKALLYPMKVEYQNATYNTLISEETIAKEFDSFAYKSKLKEDAAQSQINNAFINDYIKDTFAGYNSILDKVLAKSPFKFGSVDYSRLKISLLLTCYYCLISNNNLVLDDKDTVHLWKLPKSLSTYTRVLFKELVTEMKQEIMECARDNTIDDSLLDKLIAEPTGEIKSNEE